MATNRVIYWVRSEGVGGKDRVPMYFKGVCRRADEGWVGKDIRARPVSMGEGEYTATFGWDAFELEDGSAFKP